MKARRRRVTRSSPSPGRVTSHVTREGNPKTPYRTVSEARSAAQLAWTLHQVDLDAYQCEYCHQWHIGKRFREE